MSEYTALDRTSLWDYCTWLETQPNKASHFIPRGILDDKEPRRDVLFFTPGLIWGWRVRKNWREVLLSRQEEPSVRVVVDVNASVRRGLTVGEMAVLLCVPRRKVQALCRSGVFPSFGSRLSRDGPMAPRHDRACSTSGHRNSAAYDGIC